jgi:hypothetical protein
MRIIRSRSMAPCHLAWTGVARAFNRIGMGTQEFVCLDCFAVTAWFAVMNWPVVTGLRAVTMRVRMTVDADVRGMNQANGQDR